MAQNYLGKINGSEEHCIRSVISCSNREIDYFFEHTLCCHQPLSSPHTNQQHTISCYLLYTRRRRGPSLVFLLPSFLPSSSSPHTIPCLRRVGLCVSRGLVYFSRPTTQGRGQCVVARGHWPEVGIYKRKIVRTKGRKHALDQEKK